MERYDEEIKEQIPVPAIVDNKNASSREKSNRYGHIPRPNQSRGETSIQTNTPKSRFDPSEKTSHPTTAKNERQSLSSKKVKLPGLNLKNFKTPAAKERNRS